jgi:serine/threonine protein kinase
VAVALPGYLMIDDLYQKLDLPSSESMSEIHTGGTAAVHQAKLIDEQLIQKHQVVDVAIKRIFGDRMKNPTVFDSFRYEVTIMSSLPASPYLVQLIGYSIDPMAIVMRNYEMNLQEVLDGGDYFIDEQTMNKAITEIALAMQIIHSKDIVHFDLKPGINMTNVW